MNKRICDYCDEPWPKHSIKISRTPNDETVFIEICGYCLKDILRYVDHIQEGSNE